MTQEEQNIEQAAEKYCIINQFSPNEHIFTNGRGSEYTTPIMLFITGAKSPEAKAFHTKGMYSEKEVINMIIEFGHHINRKYNPYHPVIGEVKNWFEENKKK